MDWATKDVKVVKIKWRTAKEGLRFFGDAPPALILSNNEKDNKNKEKKEKSEKEKVVRIVGGRDAGLKGNVVFRIGDDYLVLELSRDQRLHTYDRQSRCDWLFILRLTWLC